MGDALLYKWGAHYYPNGGCYPHPMVSLYDRPEDTKVVSKYARLRHLVDTYLDAHKYNRRIGRNISWWLLNYEVI